MKNSVLLDEILAIIKTIKDDNEKLQMLLAFLNDEIDEQEVLEIEVPEKYKDIISKIAQVIDSGEVCYLNPDSLEMEEDFSDEMKDYLDEEYKLDLKYHTWEKCIKFDPLDSFESFKIMERYTEIIEDKQIQDKLLQALSRHKPFANFKNILDNSDYRQDWFDFKHKQIMGHVKSLIISEFENLED